MRDPLELRINLLGRLGVICRSWLGVTGVEGTYRGLSVYSVEYSRLHPSACITVSANQE